MERKYINCETITMYRKLTKILTQHLVIIVTYVLIQNAFAQSDLQQYRQVVIDFERMNEGDEPLGFNIVLTGDGGPSTWVVVTDENERGESKVVLQSSSQNENYRFPICVYEDFASKDVDISVRFKPVSGRIDQAAGLVWRYQDPNNYYVVRANALEDNVVLYKMVNGRRTDLKPVGSGLFAYGKDVNVPGNQWSLLEVTVKSNRFTVRLNGEKLFDVEDQTFKEAGKVGIWTKADSITMFDDFTITSHDLQ
jgi:hypothetical protein